MEDELIKQVWDEVLVILKDTIGEPTYGTWIVPLVPHSLDDNCFCALTGQNLAVQILQKTKRIYLVLFLKYVEEKSILKLFMMKI